MDLQILTQPELKPEAGCTLLHDSLHCTEDELLATMQQAMPAPATLVLWRRQDIVWGTWDGQSATLADGSAITPRLVQELRLFDASAELHLTRCGSGFRGRHVRDLPDGAPDAQTRPWDRIDLLARLWGQEVQKKTCPRGFIYLEDSERNIHMTIPCASSGAGDYGLCTRNYVGTACEATGQAGYVDFRFLAIVPMAKSALDELKGGHPHGN